MKNRKKNREERTLSLVKSHRISTSYACSFFWWHSFFITPKTPLLVSSHNSIVKCFFVSQTALTKNKKFHKKPTDSRHRVASHAANCLFDIKLFISNLHTAKKNEKKYIRVELAIFPLNSFAHEIHHTGPWVGLWRLSSAEQINFVTFSTCQNMGMTRISNEIYHRKNNRTGRLFFSLLPPSHSSDRYK